jgi:hypothetical protein
MKTYINKIILKDIWSDLKTRENKVIYLPNLVEFMNSIGKWEQEDGTIKQEKHGKNSAKWFQKFMNGDWLEDTFLNLNSDKATFIESNHGILERNGRGNNIPDFNIKLSNNSPSVLKEYTLDTKTYFDCSSSHEAKTIVVTNYKSSLHYTKVALLFCMYSHKFLWAFRIGDTNSYSIPRFFEELNDIEKNIIRELNLPDEVEMLTIEVPSDATDDQLPEYASYHFTTYKVIQDF